MVWFIQFLFFYILKEGYPVLFFALYNKKCYLYIRNKKNKMSKKVLIIDKENSKAIHCCYSEAAKIIGIVPLTVRRWAKVGKLKEKGDFLCLFDYEEIKIERGFNLKK